MKFNPGKAKKLGTYADIDASNVQDEGLITKILIQYRNENYIAPLLAQFCDVPKMVGKYWEFDKTNFDIPDAKRAAGSDFNQATIGISKNSFECIEQGLEYPLDYLVEDNANPEIQLKEQIAINLKDQCSNSFELEVANMVCSGGSYASSSFYITPSVLWSNDAADIIGDLKTGKAQIEDSIGRSPNTFWCSNKVWRAMEYHPNLIAELRGRIDKVAGRMRVEDLKALLEFDNVFIGKAQYNTAAKGQTVSLSPIWGKNAGLCYIPPKPSQFAPSFIYTFKKVGSEYTRSYMYKDIFNVLRVVIGQLDPVITGTSAGYLFSGAIA
jgi:hypothetical protein